MRRERSDTREERPEALVSKRPELPHFHKADVEVGTTATAETYTTSSTPSPREWINRNPVGDGEKQIEQGVTCRTSPTLREFWTRYLRYAETNKRPSSVLRNKLNLNPA